MERKDERFNLIEYGRDSIKLNELFIQLDEKGEIRGEVIDISQNGLGFEIKGINDDQAENIINSGETYIKLIAGNEILLISVKLVWKNKKRDNGNLVLSGGYEIISISPEDNLKLSNLIEVIRKSISK